MVILAFTTLSMMPGRATVESRNRTFEEAPGTPLGVQLAAVPQFVLALTPFTAFHNDCALAGRAADTTVATIAGNRNFNRSGIFFIRMAGMVILGLNRFASECGRAEKRRMVWLEIYDYAVKSTKSADLSCRIECGHILNHASWPNPGLK